MNVATRPIPQDTLRDQSRASDPRHSAWVSANAGSGKTHVLARRVIRLLLEGTEPSKILCLTYTKAAAANMGARVFKELARWTALPEEEFRLAVAEAGGRTPDPATLTLARQLFARALETPGGLKIQTIHAFCEAVLHQFPLEANIAGHFELLDSRMEAALVAEARRDLLTGIAGGHDPALAEAFATVLDRGGEFGLETLLNEVVNRRDELRRFIAEIAPAPYSALYEAFELSCETEDDPCFGLWPDSYFGAGLAETMADRANRAGKLAAGKFAASLAGICEADPAERFDALAALFASDEKTGWQPRKTRQILAKGVVEHFPEFEAEFARFSDAICSACERRALRAMLDATSAALTLADWLIGRYERLKSARGFLDFNDLIRKTAHLLSRQDASAWVQYKLDRGIDHILIDEAQDTSPEQWEVVRKLAEEFFAGRSARDVPRTIFAVGDEKQSIYSFQGAQPQEFALSGRSFGSRVQAAQRGFEFVKLQRSFRSVDDVLAAVDCVFNDPEIRKGLTLDPEPIEHKAVREGDPGYVEVWPSLGATAVEEPDDWRQAIDHASAPAVQLANQIAATVAGWIRAGEIIEGTGKRLSAGDVVVLVRKRDRFVNALSSALKERGVEVAGADRLSLQAHIAVKDLIAIGRIALQPEDDLSLAALLRSPVFGLSDEDLFSIAWGRGKSTSLYAALRTKGKESARFAAVAAQIDRWRDEAGFRPAFEFYATLLGRDGVRGRLVARLGRETGEILDEFLNFCLAEERVGSPGLEHLIETLESAGPEIKREMDQSRDEVRIMTVHAAKGLEAPVVFLVDSGSAPFSPSHLPRLVPFAPPEGAWVPSVKGWLWRYSKDVANRESRRIEAAIAEKAAEEYRRLLYVGMTRAGDRLIVCGYHGQRAPAATTWHAIVMTALSASGKMQERPHPAGEGVVLRFRVTEAPAREPKAEQQQEATCYPAMPAHWLSPAPSAEPVPRPLSPSSAGALLDGRSAAQPTLSGSPVLDPEEAAPFAIRRGIAVHKLLQMLPALDPERRKRSGLAWLARYGLDWTEDQRHQLWDEVGRVLDDERFGPVFAPGSRAEVAVAGRLLVNGIERAVSGTIDRLAVSDDAVLIVDHKTTRPAPSSLAQVAPAYVGQLAIYRALLAPLYPGWPVSAALLYTEAPRLIPVPAFALDDALAAMGIA